MKLATAKAEAEAAVAAGLDFEGIFCYKDINIINGVCENCDHYCVLHIFKMMIVWYYQHGVVVHFVLHHYIKRICLNKYLKKKNLLVNLKSLYLLF